VATVTGTLAFRICNFMGSEKSVHDHLSIQMFLIIILMIRQLTDTSFIRFYFLSKYAMQPLKPKG